MPIKVYKPTSPGRRGMTAVINDGLAPNKPEKSLTKTISATGGRNNRGAHNCSF